MVKCYHLVTGEDIMGDVNGVADGVGGVLLKKPARVVTVPQGNSLGIMLMPLIPWAKKEEVYIKNESIVFEVEPNKDLLNSYNKEFGSGLVIANGMPDPMAQPGIILGG